MPVRKTFAARLCTMRQQIIQMLEKIILAQLKKKDDKKTNNSNSLFNNEYNEISLYLYNT